MAIPDPVFNRIPVTLKEEHDRFFYEAHPDRIRVYAQTDLMHLVHLAKGAVHTFDRCNPISDTWHGDWNTWQGPGADTATVIAARQWQLDRLSDVKQRIAQAIVHKRDYYENTTLGKIVKFVLKCLCMWNNGNTAAITKAEDFLLYWDSRVPVYKQDGKYTSRYFWPLVPVSWVQEKLNTGNFYNYTPNRTIEIKGMLYGQRIINGNFQALPPGFVRV